MLWSISSNLNEINSYKCINETVVGFKKCSPTDTNRIIREDYARKLLQYKTSTNTLKYASKSTSHGMPEHITQNATSVKILKDTRNFKVEVVKSFTNYKLLMLVVHMLL